MSAIRASDGSFAVPDEVAGAASFVRSAVAPGTAASPSEVAAWSWPSVALFISSFGWFSDAGTAVSADAGLQRGGGSVGDSDRFERFSQADRSARYCEGTGPQIPCRDLRPPDSPSFFKRPNAAAARRAPAAAAERARVTRSILRPRRLIPHRKPSSSLGQHYRPRHVASYAKLVQTTATPLPASVRHPTTAKRIPHDEQHRTPAW